MRAAREVEQRRETLPTKLLRDPTLPFLSGSAHAADRTLVSEQADLEAETPIRCAVLFAKDAGYRERLKRREGPACQAALDRLPR